MYIDPDDYSYEASLNRDMVDSGTRQRKARQPWNAFETFAIELGLRQFEDSRWADIKKRFPMVFSNRTAVQIKDRARTELKRRQKENEPLGPYEHIVTERQ
jgi:predicted ATPase